MRRTLIAVAIVFLAYLSLPDTSRDHRAFAQVAEPKAKLRQEIKEIEIKEGWYRFTGTEGDVTYHGAATVRKVSDDQYVVRWLMDGGSASGSYTATGMAVDGHLSLGWARSSFIGVTVYRAEKGGVLSGHWVAWQGDGKKRDETMTWEKDFAKDADL